jgi:hypothetical protein
MDAATMIYQHLDALTDGIERFLADGRDEVWHSEPYQPFHITALSDRRILFGFRTDINGEQGPDPMFSVALGDGKALLDGLVVDTLLGYFQGDVDGSGEYCAEFLQEMVRRKQAGWFQGQPQDQVADAGMTWTLGECARCGYVKLVKLDGEDCPLCGAGMLLDMPGFEL